ncbi:MAG TPA: glycosyltransferase family 4 protein [Ignavibacteria bacterium]|nr:glycosyltransferase family 4 protein [Ignavibacteria bacterium]
MIYYAGNKLSKFGYTPTFIETLTPRLSEHYELISVSEKENKILRLSDMVTSLISNRKQIEFVLIDSYSVKAFWYTYILAKLCIRFKIPYAPILRGGGYPDRLESSPGLCKYIFTNSARNISPSVYLKKHFEEKGFEVDYIPNFIPIEKYKFKKRDSLRPKLLWVRSFHEIYNPVLALEILKTLTGKYEDAELCMVGPDKDGSLQTVKARAKELGLGDSLKITGKLSKEEWLKLSEYYDIFINTTNFDNHPVSVIEAMALGLPVVSTNVGGLPFLIENNKDGILVNPGSKEEFVESIEKIISDDQTALDLALNARKKVEEFDWEVVKHKWFELINSVTKN